MPSRVAEQLQQRGPEDPRIVVCEERPEAHHDDVDRRRAGGEPGLEAGDHVGDVSVAEARQHARRVDLGIGANLGDHTGDERAVTAFEVERLGRVVVGLVLVVDRDRSVGLRNRVAPGGVHRAAVEERVLRPPRAVLDDGAQPGVEDEDLRTAAAIEVQPSTQGPRLLGGFGGRQHHLANDAVGVWLRGHDVPEEGHLASPGRR